MRRINKDGLLFFYLTRSLAYQGRQMFPCSVLLYSLLAATGLAALLWPAQQNVSLIGITGLLVAAGLAAFKAFFVFTHGVFLTLAL